MAKLALEIFVSSTYLDLIEERKAVFDAITECGHLPVGMERFAASSDAPSILVKRKVSRADAFLLIIGARYGSSASDGSDLSFTEIEYQKASANGKNIYPFISKADRLLKLNQVDTGISADRLDKFTKLIEKEYTVAYWSDAAELKAQVIRCLSDSDFLAPQIKTSSFFKHKVPDTETQNNSQSIDVVDDSLKNRSTESDAAPIHINDQIVNEYKSLINKYAALTVSAKTDLETLLRSRQSEFLLPDFQIEYRTKTIDALREKLRRPSKHEKYSRLGDITDLIGIRIITYLQEDVSTAAEILSHFFKTAIVEAQAKGRDDDSVEFGYSSVHQLIKLEKNSESFVVEVQIRSILQHAWGQIEHKYGYKAKAKNSETGIRRAFAKASSLLEVSDDIFDDIALLTKAIEESVASEDFSKVLVERSPSLDLNLISLASYFKNGNRASLQTLQDLSKELSLAINDLDISADIHKQDFELFLDLLKIAQVTNIYQLNESIESVSNEKFLTGIVSLAQQHLDLNVKSISELDVFLFLCLILASSAASDEAQILAITESLEHYGMTSDNARLIVEITAPKSNND